MSVSAARGCTAAAHPGGLNIQGGYAVGGDFEGGMMGTATVTYLEQLFFGRGDVDDQRGATYANYCASGSREVRNRIWGWGREVLTQLAF